MCSQLPVLSQGPELVPGVIRRVATLLFLICPFLHTCCASTSQACMMGFCGSPRRRAVCSQGTNDLRGPAAPRATQLIAKVTAGM